MTIRTRWFLLGAGIVLGILWAVASSSLASAQAGTIPSCETEPLQCVSIANVHTSSEGNYIDGTFFLVSNEDTTVLTGTQTVYAPNGSRSATSPIIPVPIGISRPTYLEAWAGTGISGTLVITSPQRFSVQVIDPQIGNCINTTDLTCMNIYLSPGGTQYSVLNTEAKAFTYTHDVYRNGAFVARETHVIGRFERIVYQLPAATQATRRAETATYRVLVYVPEPRQWFRFFPFASR